MSGNFENSLVRIKEQDKRLFYLILQQKFLTFDLILKWFPCSDEINNGKRPKLYFRLYKMLKAGFLSKKKLDGHDVYLLALNGLNTIKDINKHGLSLVAWPDLEFVKHDLAISEVRYYLESIGGYDWVADREFRLFQEKMPIIPDGAVTISNRNVFIEIELSQKSKDRYKNIAAIYTAEKGPDKVIYFYKDSSVISNLMGIVNGHDRLGFFPYNDVLTNPNELMGMWRNRRVCLNDFLNLK